MRRSLPGILLALCVLSVQPLIGAEVIDVQAFADPSDAVRYRGLLDELRCPKCLNTNLSGSDSPIAADLRNLVAERIRAGDNDAAIREFLQQRYGDFILYRPPVNARTLVLWVAPIFMLLLGLVAVWLLVRGRRQRDDVVLDDAERAAAERLLALPGGLPTVAADHDGRGPAARQ